MVSFATSSSVLSRNATSTSSEAIRLGTSRTRLAKSKVHCKSNLIHLFKLTWVLTAVIGFQNDLAQWKIELQTQSAGEGVIYIESSRFITPKLIQYGLLNPKKYYFLVSSMIELQTENGIDVS
jgi:hypothetical protein